MYRAPTQRREVELSTFILLTMGCAETGCRRVLCMSTGRLTGLPLSSTLDEGQVQEPMGGFD